MTPQEKLAAAIWAMIGNDDDRPVEEQVDEMADGDWKRYDHTDYVVLAAYYDELAVEQGGGI